jgi:hypothetical protein
VKDKKTNWWNVVAIVMVVITVFHRLSDFPWESLDFDNGGLSKLPYSALYLLGYGVVISYLFLKEAKTRD